MSFVISSGRPDSPDAVELIEELEAHLAGPPVAGYRDDPVSRCYEMKLE